MMLIVFGTSLAVLFMFVFLLADQIERSFRQQQKIANQRASIMVFLIAFAFFQTAIMDGIPCLKQI